MIRAFALALAPCALAQVNPAREPGQDPETSVTERLSAQIPLDHEFVDESGAKVAFRSFFARGRPVLLNLGYYGCPALCGAVLNGVVDGLKGVSLEPGKDFEIVTVSIDPKEQPELAKKKKDAYLEVYGREGARAHWHFLTSPDDQVKRLAQAVGFGYRYDEVTRQYLHGAAIMFLSPSGKLTRYLYGVELAPRDLRFAIVESGEGRVGTTWDRILLNCYGYDPRVRGYAVAARTVMFWGGAVTMLGVFSMIFVFFRRERRESRIRARDAAMAPAVT